LIEIQAPALGDAAPELYEQQELWATKPDPRFTAIDVLSDAVAEVALGDLDSVRFDRPLLQKIGGLKRVFSDHLRAVVLPREGRMLTDRIAETADRIAMNTPAPQQVRVVGHLDMIRKSTRSFGLQLDDGSEVYGVLQDIADIENLKAFFGQRVLVLGEAVYRASGSLLRIDAHAVESGDEVPGIFSKVPTPQRLTSSQSRKGLGHGWADFSDYFGGWPGDETDEEWAEVLSELKR
jgi:hypothetical protein